jgi:hypothetical protein
MSSKLSIAMTTYNGEQFLPAQLDSFAAQSRLPDELVACDDASTDSTVELLEEFARRAPFDVRIVRNPANFGHERNFAQAVELCTGDLIFLADQDDAWYPEKLESVARAFESDPDALLFVNDVLITDENLEPTGRTVLGQMRAAGVLGANSKSLTLGCATAFRSRLRLLVSPIPPLEYGHDSWIHDFTEVLGGRRVLSRVLQLYRRHGANASNWAFNSSVRASPFVVIQPSAGRDLTREYAKRAQALLLMRERVEALGRNGLAELRIEGRYEAIIQHLTSAAEAWRRRSRVFHRGWLGRKAVAAGLLVRGDYRYFLGWRSFVKDLLR